MSSFADFSTELINFGWFVSVHPEQFADIVKMAKTVIAENIFILADICFLGFYVVVRSNTKFYLVIDFWAI